MALGTVGKPSLGGLGSVALEATAQSKGEWLIDGLLVDGNRYLRGLVVVPEDRHSLMYLPRSGTCR